MNLHETPTFTAAQLAASMALIADGEMVRLDDGWTGCRDRGGVPESCLPKTVRGTRNEPCPCGSGKKFKKCCRGKAQPDGEPVKGGE